MAKKFDGTEVIEEFEKAFGIKREDMTPEQLMFLIRMIKSARTYCRSNSALYNMMNRSFPNFRFTTVSDTWQGKPWDRLVITPKVKKEGVAEFKEATGDE